MRIWAKLFKQVDVFAPLNSGKIQMSVAEYEHNFSFVFVRYTNTSQWWGLFLRALQLPVVIFRLFIFVLDHDVLLIRSPSHLGLFANVLAFLLGKKSITKYAGYFGHFEEERIPSIIERNLILRILRPPHYVMVYGRQEKDHLISFIPAVISQSEIATIRAFKKVKTQVSDSLVFYSLGKLLRVKNYHLALEGFGALHREFPDLSWSYRLIGDGPEKENLFHLCKRLGISNRVVFVGKLEYMEAMKELTNADVVIMPGVKEGWPKVVADSWAAGAVPLAASAGIVPQIIREGKNGYLFSPDSISFKEKVKYLFDHKEELESISQISLSFCKAVCIEEFEARVTKLCTDKLNLKT
jgi:glycosyltransferase involved in cell wall biosynthesis